MKTKFFLFVFLFCCALSLSAQNPLVGTWQMNNNGTRSFKTITPTHFIVFTDSTSGEKTEFIRSHGGTYKLKGDKYVETIDIASWEDYGKEKTDFIVRVEGDKFYQKGTLTASDGTVLAIDEVWQKVKVDRPNTSNQGLGAWEQLSSSYTLPDGTKGADTNANATRFQVISPTHWIRINHRDDVFESAMGGTYTLVGNTVYPNLDFSSLPIDKNLKYEIAQSLKEDKLYQKGIAKDGSGRQVVQFEDIFQKAGNKKLARANPKK